MTVAINPNDTAYTEPLEALVSKINEGVEPSSADIGWLEKWALDDFSGDWDYMAFSTDKLCDEAFNDSYALEALGIEDGELSDRQRIIFGRTYLKARIDEGDYDGSEIYVKEIQVRSSTGATATLVFALSEAPLMCEVEFLGGCVEGSDIDILEVNGYLDEYTLESLSDEWILSHWTKE